MRRNTILRVLGATLAEKDPSTQHHVLRTQLYAVGIGRNMRCSGPTLKNLEMAALLHDIGKVYIDQCVLTKPGPLSADETAQMQCHPVTGAQLAARLDLPPMVVAGIRHHHERWDGGGYPDGVKGSEIPFVARVLAVADVYDALSSPRCYRPGLPRDDVRAMMRAELGAQFDADVLRTFFRYLPALEAEVAELELAPPPEFAAQLAAATGQD